MESRADEDKPFVLDQPMAHQPVMLAEVLLELNVQPEGIYIDGTFGRGGHSKAIVDQLGESGQLYVMDKDPEAIAAAKSQFAQDGRVKIVHASFAAMAERAQEYGILGKVAGVFLDLGVSSPQLDDARRGFSFRNEGPLDMRMNPQQGVSVATWLETACETEIVRVLREYGEERYAKRIAQAILQLRAEVNITTTTQLAQLIAKSVPTHERYKDPATRSFQALRIFINQELEDLQRGLNQVLTVLAPHGRLVVLSFHSLEDRMVKRFMRDQVRGELLPQGLPVKSSHLPGAMCGLGKALRASASEVARNPRARSATLRVAEKI